MNSSDQFAELHAKYHGKTIKTPINVADRLSTFFGTLSVLPSPTRLSIELRSNITAGRQIFLGIGLDIQSEPAIEPCPPEFDFALSRPIDLSPEDAQLLVDRGIVFSPQ